MRPADSRAHLVEFLGSLAGPVENLDSLGVLQVVLYLEDVYGIRLVEHRIEAAELRSVDGLLGIIARCG